MARRSCDSNRPPSNHESLCHGGLQARARGLKFWGINWAKWVCNSIIDFSCFVRPTAYFCAPPLHIHVVFQLLCMACVINFFLEHMKCNIYISDVDLVRHFWTKSSFRHNDCWNHVMGMGGGCGLDPIFPLIRWKVSTHSLLWDKFYLNSRTSPSNIAF